MILTLFLNLIYGLILFVTQVLPTGQLPSSISDGINYFWGILNAFSYIFPVNALFLALLFAFTFDIAMMLWHLITWGLKKVPQMN